MSAAREKTQADFDLERFIGMFDSALTSDDPRVKNALQSLMMMVILTESESSNVNNVKIGPLRQLYEDVYTINRRLNRVESEVMDRQIRPQQAMEEQAKKQWPDVQAKYTMSAAEVMAHDMDRQITATFAKQINGGLLPAKAKGLLSK